MCTRLRTLAEGVDCAKSGRRVRTQDRLGVATDASGRVGAEQLVRLEALLARLEGGPRILVTHYPVWGAGGQRERPGHGLHDLEELLAVAARGGVGLWLHGHNHHPYQHLGRDGLPFPVICAGSTTERGRWSYGEYTLAGDRLCGVFCRVVLLRIPLVLQHAH